MLDRGDEALSVRRQCALLGVARSGVYQARKPANDNDAALMRRIDELFTAWPFLGSRRITAMLRAEGVLVNRKRVQRLMRLMGIAALGPKPRTSKPAPGHKIYPYLLRDMAIERVNHVWAADIAYLPIGRGFLYLVAIIDWASRAGLAWRLSNTMDVSFCLTALEERSGDVRQTRDFQHRPGLAVHLGRLHRHARPSRRRHHHGRARPLDGQRVHRATVAVAEVRRRLSQGLRRRPRGRTRHRRMGRLLQPRITTPICLCH
jgi:transposase InsO family protein